MVKRLNGPVDVEFINETFFPEEKFIETVNYGQCFLWAYIAYRIYNNAELHDVDCHAFIRCKASNKFYDCENPLGVDNWYSLTACKYAWSKYDTKKYHSTAGGFRKEWKESAESFDINWDEVNIKILKVLNEKRINS